MLKTSKYNLIVEEDNGEILIVNLLSSKFIKVSFEKRDQYKFLLKNDTIIDVKEEYQLELVEKGFLIDSDFDEMEIAKYNLDKAVYGNDILEITIIPTNDCNFKCLYCYQEDKEYFYMTDREEKKILLYLEKNVRRFKKLRINWFGGEPLLMKKFIISMMSKIKEICKKNKVALLSGMSTNGYELDFKTFEQLYFNKVTHYQITIDGTQEIHNKYRPHKTNSNSFSTVFNNMLYIHNHFKGVYKIALRINLTVDTLENINEFIDMIRVFEKSKNIEIHWQFMQDFGGEKIKKLQDGMILDKSIGSDLVNKLNLTGLSSFYNLYFSINNILCEACRNNAFYIDYNAEIYKCSIAIYDDKYKDENKIGFINDFGEAIIDEKKNAKWVTKLTDKPKCKTCLYYPICMNAICPFSRKFKKKCPCFAEIEQLPEFLKNMNQNNLIKIIL